MRTITAFLPTLSLTLTLSCPAQAQEGDIQSVIRSQTEAFLQDDFATAFTFASPTIKRLFGTADNFGTMVRQGYPMVHRPADVKMLDLRNIDGVLRQRVMITDQKGRTHLLDYQMVETAEGWQINGVQLLPSVGAGA
ncbi:MAG: DUF4864 domain-containing protein [Rhodobacteraceae bacterium]|nr:DUF4864 domain-containing protein [Paracoccaceae bacterium]